MESTFQEKILANHISDAFHTLNVSIAFESRSQKTSLFLKVLYDLTNLTGGTKITFPKRAEQALNKPGDFIKYSQ